MSTNKILLGTLVAGFGIAAVAISANAQSRYGSGNSYGNVYDYESGNCGAACAPSLRTSQSSRYGSSISQQPYYAPQPSYIPAQPIARAPVYVDCRATGTCAPQPTTVYTQPVQTYSAPATSYSSASTYSATPSTYSSSSYSSSSSLPAECPAGTTAQSDGTCLQSGSTGYSSGSTSSYSSSPSYSSSTSSFSGTPTNCPSGTTAQSDGTCLETGSSFGSTSYDSGSSYGSGSSFSSSSSSSSYGSGSSFGAPTNCPAGTTAQSDGTCMEGGSASYGSDSSYSNVYSGGNVELYTGDATVSSTPSYGYNSDGSYGASDYSPIRK